MSQIFNDKSAASIASRDSLGLAEIKTYAQKMQDAQVTKSLIVYQVINCLISQSKHMLWVLKRTATNEIFTILHSKTVFI